MQILRNEVQKMHTDPTRLLKRAGFVRAKTPQIEDVWGDPLRGSRDDVIVKAAEGFDNLLDLPSTNEEWHEMSWEDIHKMAESAGGPTESGTYVTTRREDEK